MVCRHVEAAVGLSTANVYATAIDRYLMPRLGDVPIRDVEPANVIALQRALRDEGVGEAMAQKVLVVLSGIMRHSQAARADRPQCGAAGADRATAAQAGDSPAVARDRRADAS